jgi:putative peptidoglycan lipid II flippase
VQLAMFADTIIASFLAAGAISALYYADRINQLPIGVIGIAVGTVLLPEMARRLAAGDEAGAQHAQNRAIELTLLLTIPCLVAFLLIPDLIMRALFLRGKFTADDALAAGATLAAYAIGLIPYVLIRSMTAPFFARGDTATPVKASLTAVAVNILFKILLMGPLAQVGLAIATAIGAWVNLGLVVFFASRTGIAATDARLRRSMLLLAAIGCVLGIVIFLSSKAVAAFYRDLPAFRDEATLATLAVIGGIVYGALVLLLLGRNWFRGFRGDRQPPSAITKSS